MKDKESERFRTKSNVTTKMFADNFSWMFLVLNVQ